MTVVPYKGTGPAMNDLIGGQIDLMCDQTTNTTNQIEAGQIKPYAVTTRERIKILPNVPTLAESGVKGFDLSAWHAIWTPKGTPEPIRQKLAASLRKALADPKVGSSGLPRLAPRPCPPTWRRLTRSTSAFSQRSSAGTSFWPAVTEPQ